MRKAYVCHRTPNLWLLGVGFKGGLFITDQPEEQARREQDLL